MQAERDPAPLHAAARCLMRTQEASGDWPQQHISGVFNRNCMITYANYRLGLDTAIKPLLSHSTTGKFNSTQIFTDAEKVPEEHLPALGIG
eukprot:965995-Prorocentrum_minimum.AAC.1